VRATCLFMLEVHDSGTLNGWVRVPRSQDPEGKG
jgi:hypothetical protein